MVDLGGNNAPRHGGPVWVNPARRGRALRATAARVLLFVMARTQQDWQELFGLLVLLVFCYQGQPLCCWGIQSSFRRPVDDDVWHECLEWHAQIVTAPCARTRTLQFASSSPPTTPPRKVVTTPCQDSHFTSQLSFTPHHSTTPVFGSVLWIKSQTEPSEAAGGGGSEGSTL